MFFAAIFVGTLIIGGILNEQTAPYYVISCGGAALHFVWQLVTWSVEDPADCGAKFKVRKGSSQVVSNL